MREALAQGRLKRITREWLAGKAASMDAVRAVQLGGRLGCLSACRHHGLWVPRDPYLHVAVNPGEGLPPNPPSGVQFHRLAARCSTAVLPLDEALAQVLQRHDVETGLIVLESAVNKGLLHQADAAHLLESLPTRKGAAAQFYSPTSQSGSETRLRLFFQRRRIPVTPQAVIPGVGRVDLLVGSSWIIEADSHAHHSARKDVMVDRFRDMNARIEGYDHDRLSFEQMWHTWDQTQDFLLARASTKQYLRPPRPLRGIA